MGAVKEMMMEMGNAGAIPADAAMLRRMRKAAGPVRTVAVEVEVRGQRHRERGIPAEEARRLAADERVAAADRESLRWSMEVCGITPAGCCPKCGETNVTYMVPAQVWADGRLVVHGADEPEGPQPGPVAECEDCGYRGNGITLPAWTQANRHAALAAFNGPALRNALATLYRAAVEAGVSGPAVEEAARRLRGVEVEPHDHLAGYRERTAERMKRLDALDSRCQWGADFPSADADRARAQWKRIMDAQGADEVRHGL